MRKVQLKGPKSTQKQASVHLSPQALQYGVLPYRVTSTGGIEILLITTRQSQRWIIPKGRPIKGLGPAESAAREAMEEAGVRGVVREKPIGSFRFQKTLESEPDILCEVEVYALNVKRQMKCWPESQQRTLRWFQPSEAEAAVKDVGLRSLISLFVERASAKAR